MQSLGDTLPQKAATPIGLAEFAAAMAGFAPFENNAHIAIAVSGGADSMALCLLAQTWAEKYNARITAITIDHGLRPEAATEAERVHQWLAARQIAHHVLKWNPGNKSSNVQARAREARYELLDRFCHAQNILHLLTAHHLDDQAETFLLRLSRGSGLAGLSAMKAVSYLPHARLLRPLLPFPKPRLIATLQRHEQEWIEDPSNRNDQFARIRLREDRDLFEKHGLTAERLADTAAHLSRAQQAIDTMIHKAGARLVRIDPTGYAGIDFLEFKNLDDETGLRLLDRTLSCIGGQYYGARWENLSALHTALTHDPIFRPRTLSGCLIERQDGRILIQREFGTIMDELPITGETLFWDNRFRFQPPAPLPDGNYVLKPLGEAGWAKLAAVEKTLKNSYLPLPVRYALPCIAKQMAGVDEILIVPHLNYWNNDKIQQDWQSLALTFTPQHRLS